MRLSSIAFGNLRRRRSKSILLAAGLAVGVALAVAMTGITSRMRTDIENKLDEYGANIVVVPRAEHLALSYGGVDVSGTSFDVEELSETDSSLIWNIELKERIAAVAPKVIGTYSIDGRSFLIVGVDFPSEFRIKKWWTLKGEDHMNAPAHPEVASGEVVLGSAAAKSLGFESAHIAIGGRHYAVKGVLEENSSQDDAAIFMELKEAQRLLGKAGKVSMIEVSAHCGDCPIEEIVAQIAAKLPHAKVSPVRQAMTLKMQTAEQLMRFSIAVSIVVLAIGSLIVFVSMSSSVSERTKEIGVLRAIGFRKSHIMKVILTEAFVISLVAGVAGWALGNAAARLLAPEGMKLAFFDPALMALAGGASLLVGMLSSLYPAIKASRLEPLEALRYI